jgi:hypothetical protein
MYDNDEHATDLRSCTVGGDQELNFVLNEYLLKRSGHDIDGIFCLSKIRDCSLAVSTQVVMPGLILNSSTFGRQRIWATLIYVVQAVEDEDQCDTVLSEEDNIIFDGFLKTERNAPQSMLQRFFVVAVQAQVEVIGSIDTNDSILQRLKLTEIDMLASPLVKLLDCRRLSVDEAQLIGWFWWSYLT